MHRYYRLAGPQAISSTATVIYEAAPDRSAQIRNVNISNPSGSPVTVSLAINDADNVFLSETIEAGDAQSFRRKVAYNLQPFDTLIAQTAGIEDDFNDNSLATHWTPEGDGNGSVAEQNQRLELLITTGDTSYAAVTGRIVRLAEGPFVFKLEDLDVSVTWGYFEFYWQTDVAGIGVYRNEDGTWWASQTGDNFDEEFVVPSIPYWFRIRYDEPGNMLYWEISPDGSAWTEVHSNPPAGWNAEVSGQIYILVADQDDAHAYIDNVQAGLGSIPVVVVDGIEEGID